MVGGETQSASFKGGCETPKASFMGGCPTPEALFMSGWSTPKASFISAQGNALGSSAHNPLSAEGAFHSPSFRPEAGNTVLVPDIPFIELHMVFL